MLPGLILYSVGKEFGYLQNMVLHSGTSVPDCERRRCFCCCFFCQGTSIVQCC